jgi:hypothetical protein
MLIKLRGKSMIPQIIYIIITGLGLGLSMANHGKPRKNENFWHTLLGTAIGYTILIS